MPIAVISSVPAGSYPILIDGVSGSITVTEIAGSLSVTDQGDGTLQWSTDSSGAVTITVSGVVGPTHYNGTYTTDVDGLPINSTTLAAGPQCLVLPLLTGDGSPSSGETATVTPGLWVHDAASDPAYTYAINGVGTLTGLNYTIAAGDSGQSLTVTETATNSDGARTATSTGLTINDLLVVDDFEAYAATARLSDQAGWIEGNESGGHIEVFDENSQKSIRATVTGQTLIVFRAESFSTDVFSEATVGTPADDASDWCGLVVRSNDRFGDAYKLRIRDLDIELYRNNVKLTDYDVTVTAGMVVRLEANGSTIRALIDGAEVINVTDTGITTGSPDYRAGLTMRTDGVNTVPTFSQFRAGNL